MDFNLTELESIFRGINEIIKNLERQYQFDNTTRVYLSNGDIIDYSISRSSLAHLLGIDTNYLASTGVFSETNSYALLKLMSENAFKINQLKSKGIIDYNKLFSKNLIAKLSGFWSNIKIGPNETELVCKYEPSRSYKSDIPSEKCNYAIIKNTHGRYFMLWLVKNDDNTYIPMSNRAFDCFEDIESQLNALLTNQEITLVNAVKIGYDKPFNLDDKLKSKKIQILQDYKEKYNCSIDLTRDLRYMLGKAIDHRSDARENYGVTNYIVDSMRSGSIIDMTTISDRNLSYIVEAFNDFICMSQSDSNPKVGETYSSIKNELGELKEKFLKANQIIVEQSDTINRLSTENQVLTSENAELNEMQAKVFEIVKPKEKQIQ